MLWILAAIGLLLSLPASLLVLPLRLQIDSDAILCRLSMRPLGQGSVFYAGGHWKVAWSLPFYRKEYTLEELLEKAFVRNQKKERKANSGRIKKQGKKAPQLSVILHMLKQVKMNECTVHIDTGDQMWNGMLYPLFYWAGRMWNINTAIRFDGVTVVRIDMQTSGARMLKAYLTRPINKKTQ